LDTIKVCFQLFWHAIIIFHIFIVDVNKSVWVFKTFLLNNTY
jgi:hypothetical protein